MNHIIIERGVGAVKDTSFLLAKFRPPTISKVARYVSELLLSELLNYLPSTTADELKAMSYS